MWFLKKIFYLFAAADLFIAHARSVKPGLRAIVLSARNGQNLEEWYDWLRARRTLTSVARKP